MLCLLGVLNMQEVGVLEGIESGPPPTMERQHSERPPWERRARTEQPRSQQRVRHPGPFPGPRGGLTGREGPCAPPSSRWTGSWGTRGQGSSAPEASRPPLPGAAVGAQGVARSQWPHLGGNSQSSDHSEGAHHSRCREWVAAHQDSEIRERTGVPV